MATEDGFKTEDVEELEAAFEKIEGEHKFITNRSFFDWDVELEDLGW